MEIGSNKTGEATRVRERTNKRTLRLKGKYQGRKEKVPEGDTQVRDEEKENDRHVQNSGIGSGEYRRARRRI